MTESQLTQGADVLKKLKSLQLHKSKIDMIGTPVLFIAGEDWEEDENMTVVDASRFFNITTYRLYINNEISRLQKEFDSL